MKRVRPILCPILRWSGAVLALWLGACTLIGIVAMEGALHAPRRPLLERDVAQAQQMSSRDHTALDEVAIQADDGAMLRAWSFRLASGNGDAVILLHGQGDSRAGMLGYADLLLRHGYSVLIPDSRAQGASGGEIVTYGVLEAEDVRRWYAWLQRAETPRCIYGLGDSMGAAIVLQATASEPGLCAIVAESPFASFREAAFVRLGQAMHTGPWIGETLLLPAYDAGLLYALLRYGVDPAQDSPEEAAAQSRVPILLIHGLADSNLPARFSEELKARNPAIVLWEPAHAEHCGAYAAEPAEYERRVLGWFADHPPAGAPGKK